MRLFWLFFFFEGRINRTAYWGAIGTLLLCLSALIGLLFILVGPNGHLQPTHKLSVGVLALVVAYSALAVSAKRFHDRSRSAWFVLLLNVPNGLMGFAERLQNGALASVVWVVAIALGVWLFVELGFLRGTSGPNKYGPDPLSAFLKPEAA